MSDEPKVEIRNSKMETGNSKIETGKSKFENRQSPDIATYELVIPIWAAQIPRAWGIEACLALSAEWHELSAESLVVTFTCGARLRAKTAEGQAVLEHMAQHGYVREL